jgi:hypothetical protein
MPHEPNQGYAITIYGSFHDWFIGGTVRRCSLTFSSSVACEVKTIRCLALAQIKEQE